MSNSIRHNHTTLSVDQQFHFFGHLIDSPGPLALKAGPLSLLYENGNIRYIHHGEKELISKICVAVRDKVWVTLPNQVTMQKIDQKNDFFNLSFDARSKNAEIDFSWHGTITGQSDGTIVFEISGEALKTFFSNRIGILVHHPIAAAGLPVRYKNAGGAVLWGQFPNDISPHSPFSGFSSLSHEVLTGLWVRLDFENAIWEMEDHRNFGDAGFKIFSPPLSQPVPFLFKKGDESRQKVTLSLECKTLPVVKVKPPFSTVTATGPTGMRLVQYGFSINDAIDDPDFKVPSSAILKLAPSHLRVLLDVDVSGWETRLIKAGELTGRFNTPFWIAIRTPGDQLPDHFARVLMRLDRPPERIIISRGKRPANTTPEMVDNLRAQVKFAGMDLLVGGGTDHNFVFINRNPPPFEKIDFLSWSINPQQHNNDIASIMENLIAQQAAAQSAAKIAPCLPLVVSPVTLRPRWNISAPGFQQPVDAEGLPRDVDPKQWGLFGAAWTLVSIKYLSESPVDAATYFELTGPKGLLYSRAEYSQPAFDQHAHASIYPLFHVFKELANHQGAEMIALSVSRPQVVNGLALQTGNGMILYLANLTSSNQQVKVKAPRTEISAGSIMSEKDWERIVFDEDYEFGRLDFKTDASSGTIEFVLPPYAIMKLE